MYSILVKDDNGCEVTTVVTLNDNPFIITTTNLINATCVGSKDGVISLLFSGATPDMGNYTISGNVTGTPFTISSDRISIGLLNPGDYEITISDNVSQCDTVYSFSIGYTDTITANITVTDPPCAGGVNGSISIRWVMVYSAHPIRIPSSKRESRSPPNVVSVVHSTIVRLRQVTIWLSSQKEVVYRTPFLLRSMTRHQCLSLSVRNYPDNCIPTPAGDIWFQILNGSGSYTLDAGAGFQDADTLFNLNSGNYTLTVTDDVSGCTATLPFVINSWDDNEEADISFVIDGTPCEGGTVTVLFQGGALPPGAGVLWSTGEVTTTITITETDTLSVDVILGGPIFCILNDTVQIECTKKLDLDITVLQPLCGEGAVGGPYTGTVIVDTANATAPVTWIWSFPDTTTSGIYSGLLPGKYYVTVTDALDSIAVDSFEVIAPNALQLMFSNIDSTSCPEDVTWEL